MIKTHLKEGKSPNISPKSGVRFFLSNLLPDDNSNIYFKKYLFRVPAIN